jgi:hypothetical protein
MIAREPGSSWGRAVSLVLTTILIGGAPVFAFA